MKFRKKPIEVEAIQFNQSNFQECCDFIGEVNLSDGTSQDEGCIEIVTLEGNMMCRLNDWIIRGVKGEIYPCKPDIFELTYENTKPI